MTLKGKRVRVNSSKHPVTNGRNGTVIAVNKEFALVKFDDPVKDLHQEVASYNRKDLKITSSLEIKIRRALR